MAKSPENNDKSKYTPIEGSERRPSKTAKLLGPADPKEHFTVTIVLRRRGDMVPLPDFDSYLKKPLKERQRMEDAEFAQKYGAHPDDMDKVLKFVSEAGLEVIESNASRRTVVVSGTVDQMNKAFGVTLNQYQHERAHGKDKPVTETYRGRDGFVHTPSSLKNIVTGVFGLDNRNITKVNSSDPQGTATMTVGAVTQLYNFPANKANGQTIGIVSMAGYQTVDINATCGGQAPVITHVSIDGAVNDGTADGETTQDICIAALAAPGAAIAVYFLPGGQQSWIDLFHRVAHPNPGDPACSVVSSSFYISNGDDLKTLAQDGVSAAFLYAMSDVFQDVAMQGITVCIASGDTGTDSKVGDGWAHIQYPASDPWVLSVGGTTIGNVSEATFDEYVWNDSFFGGQVGATGGGISDFFALPSYQNLANIPASLNPGARIGRGVPDVAANASPNSGFIITTALAPSIGDGTSASAPLWAGLIAVINAALGHNVGFVNPAIYSLGTAAFRNIAGNSGPADNGLNGVAGYTAKPGWNACTGWGAPDGVKLLNALKAKLVR